MLHLPLASVLWCWGCPAAQGAAGSYLPQQEEETIVLGAGETALVAQIQAPPRTYVAEVAAEYPPH
jgi:hypothetical protein